MGRSLSRRQPGARRGRSVAWLWVGRGPDPQLALDADAVQPIWSGLKVYRGDESCSLNMACVEGFASRAQPAGSSKEFDEVLVIDPDTRASHAPLGELELHGAVGLLVEGVGVVTGGGEHRVHEGAR